MVCESDFLRVNASGTSDRLTAAVKLDLRQLTDDLGRFIDLGGLALAGDGDGQIQWTRSPTGDFQTGGQISLRNFQCVVPQRQPWTEDSLDVTLGAKGHADSSATRLDEAAVQLRGRRAGQHPPLAARYRMEPPHALVGRRANARPPRRWAGRLAPLAAMQGVRLAGDYRAAAQAMVAADAFTITQSKINATGLTISGRSFNWSDPALELTAVGHYDFAAARLTIDAATLAGSAISLTAKQIVCSTPADGPPQITGTLNYEGDVSRMQPWIVATIGPTNLRFAGRLTGSAVVQQSEGVIACKAESDIEQLTVASPSGQSFQDPRVHSVLHCNYQPDGQIRIDGTAIQFAAANVFGLPIGAGELRMHMAERTLQSDPLQVSCNKGTISLKPELRMAAFPPEFRLSAGTLASRIQLDPAACRTALMYVVPVLASVTQSQGEFSVLIDGCRFPLGDITRAEVGGRVIVHSAAMTPGPLVEQLAMLLSAKPALVRIPPESVILFRMMGGRIYHQGLVLEFPELTMRTYGSVGLDDSLKLMVETSVPLTWLPQGAVTDAIRKQKMQIPIGGTLGAPRLDVAELARVKDQVLGNLAHGVLQSDLGSQLNRFLQPGR